MSSTAIVSQPHRTAPSKPSRAGVSDREILAFNGFGALIVGLALLAIAGWLGLGAFEANGYGGVRVSMGEIGLASVIALAGAIVLMGLTILQPNYAAVCVLFGNYVGTLNKPGFWWINPFYSKTLVSLRLRTIECGPLKVNDAIGNPVDIGAVYAMRICDAAKAVLEVDNYGKYAEIQSESSLRHTASSHPYDDDIEASPSQDGADVTSPTREAAPIKTARSTLRDGGEALNESLLSDLQDRLSVAGWQVEEARLTHLAYSPEIAPAMLRKQAARAVIAARKMVVQGALGIVDDAIKHIEEKHMKSEGDRAAGTIDPERKASMISNLLVVLVGDKEAAPVVNVGSLYS